MTENEFITSYTQADEKTKKQVRELLGIEPDPIKNDFRFDLLLIGFQDISPIVEHMEQLKIIMDSKKYDNCIDAYLLGYMHGKRKERTKRKNACCR